MIKNSKCPFCKSEECQILESAKGYVGYQCSNLFPTTWVYLSEDLISELGDAKEKGLNLICEKVLHNPYCIIGNMRYKWHFYYDAGQEISEYENQEKYYVNLEPLLKKYPKTFIEKAYRALVNLSMLYPEYGDVFSNGNIVNHLIFQDEQHKFVHNGGLLGLLCELGYLEYHANTQQYHISASGWEKVDELQKQSMLEKKGFIAMYFGDETRIIRESFRKAIMDSGYEVSVIDEKEHNNQIVPEIFYEIERSKFVVVDVTYPNYGAYYEAGYAQAMGKQVIVCCRKSAFNHSETSPHFDIAQKSMIIWEDEEDLVSRLKRRIEATVE